ncbi:MAG: Formyltransferase/hydrolase complex Fhc subunit [Planctomycetota bacterium]|jgi:formylmethanofuran dehydrogenase subunit C
MKWTLQLRNDAVFAGPVEARSLVHNIQQCQSVDQVQSMTLTVGRTKVSFGDLCEIHGQSDADHVVELSGDFSQWNGLGFGFKSGYLRIIGETGARTGSEISGGIIEIFGNTGAWTGTAASGGRIVVHGDTGNWLGCNWPGETRGINGCELIVNGNVGDHVGVRMRRGCIAVQGQAGSGLGRSMIAGSIFVSGTVGGPIGTGMKRGSIVIASQPVQNTIPLWQSNGFPDAGRFRPLTLNMQLKYLAECGWKAADTMQELPDCQRFIGDLANSGLGEILVLS